jgi:hypothetical protein
MTGKFRPRTCITSPANNRNGSILMWIAGILVVVFGMTPIDPGLLLLALCVLLVAPVFYGLLLWIKVFEAREIEV